MSILHARRAQMRCYQPANPKDGEVVWSGTTLTWRGVLSFDKTPLPSPPSDLSSPHPTPPTASEPVLLDYIPYFMDTKRGGVP
jgi:hypothetical protein